LDLEELDKLLDLLFLSGILNPNSIFLSGMLTFASFDLDKLNELFEEELLFLSFTLNSKSIFCSGIVTFASFVLEELDELYYFISN